MELTLSKNSPVNTVLYDAQGQPQYRIFTPFAFSGQTTTIYRVTGHRPGPVDYNHKTPYSGEEELARIHWHSFSRMTTLEYNGQSVEFHSFLPSQSGLFKHTRRKLTGPDNRTYDWHMKSACYLDFTDGSGSTIPVARFHLDNIWKSKKPMLEISPAGMDMVDLIVITFVYVQNKEEESEHTATASATAAAVS
ncbi:hypothetical protein A0H81_00637 [Grifola frondosa]|uniref:DUF6593 domain-containing protein n=1 Tax=Grifola frondosa TaxID=5627 RepID=A0A1C7MS13_GRIFR|nr:hypothetical protein A0H81_00637 [Grifola frondosa]